MRRTIVSRRAALLAAASTCGGVFLWMHASGAIPAWGSDSTTFPRIEASFALKPTTGNPFDFTENDVQVVFRQPDRRTIQVPAFYDGEDTWRVRLSPRKSGRYVLVKILRNGVEVPVDGVINRAFEATGPSRPGFVRIDPKDPVRFAFDSGDRYYPVGHDVAWSSGPGEDVVDIFPRMQAVGENWARVWMNHWDGKNLDWLREKNDRVPLGTLSLDVARRWDAIVDSAEKNGIYFQMTLQHHGQYSSTVNPNWDENPWSTKNGGFLATPEDFFTSDKAKALTRAKYRYIIARWGYSPSILAWELFNEVEFTDAIRNGKLETVTAWHKEMAEFLRQQDPNKHLITTSSSPEINGLFDAVDYYQAHVYAPDPVTAVAAVPHKYADGKKPAFYGEFGSSGRYEAGNGAFLHTALWTSVMNNPSGAAQYWYWDGVDREKLYGHYRGITSFLAMSGMTSLPGLLPAALTVDSPRVGEVAFAPGKGWATAIRTDFTIPPTGVVEGVADLPSYLQGDANRKMLPEITFQVDYAEDGKFTVSVGEVSKTGGHLAVQVDGAVVAEHAYAGGATISDADSTLAASIPAGKHTVKLINSGADWVTIRRIVLSPYGVTWRCMARASKDHVVAWLSRTSSDAAKANVLVPGLKSGTYQVTWWDTMAGKALREERQGVRGDGTLSLALPTDQTDVAVFIRPAGKG